ncbi:hypothetical protein Tco_0685707 [Tanacetum coccineum]
MRYSGGGAAYACCSDSPSFSHLENEDDDDDDTEEEEHLAPADPAAVAYSADQDPYIVIASRARMSIRPHGQGHRFSLGKLLGESPYIYVEDLRIPEACGIRQRDALPSPIHETEIPEMWLPLRKRLCRTTPGPGYEVGESSAAGTARQLGYGIRDTWDDLVGAIQEIAPTTLEGVNQRVIELATTVDEEDEIIYSQLDDARYDRALLRARVNMLDGDRPFHRRTAILMEEEARLSRAAWAQSMDACDQETDGDFRAAGEADYRRQRQLVEALKIVKSLKTQIDRAADIAGTLLRNLQSAELGIQSEAVASS